MGFSCKAGILAHSLLHRLVLLFDFAFVSATIFVVAVFVVLLSGKRALTRKQRHQTENTDKIAEAQARKDSVVGVFGVKDAILEMGSQEL